MDHFQQKKTTLTSFFFNFNYIYNKNNNKTIGESTGHQDTCLYSFIGAAVHFASQSTYLAWLFIHLFGWCWWALGWEHDCFYSWACYLLRLTHQLILHLPFTLPLFAWFPALPFPLNWSHQCECVLHQLWLMRV